MSWLFKVVNERILGKVHKKEEINLNKCTKYMFWLDTEKKGEYTPNINDFAQRSAMLNICENLKGGETIEKIIRCYHRYDNSLYGG